MLPGAATDNTIATSATVNQTPGGSPLSAQLVDLGSPTKAQADSYLAPCGKIRKRKKKPSKGAARNRPLHSKTGLKIAFVKRLAPLPV
jgi:hypothetical protein